MEFEFASLMWESEIESWVCSCGACYHRSDRPRPSYCMRCGKEWIRRIVK